MEERDDIFGCFMKVCFDPNLNAQDSHDLAESFRPYIWGENGICPALKRLKHEHYGKDLELALFEFYVKPTQLELQGLREIGSYRKSEKSIGIPIVIDDENFFSKSEEGRQSFLRQSVLQKLDLLAEVVKKRKLDTKVEQLKRDLEKMLG